MSTCARNGFWRMNPLISSYPQLAAERAQGHCQIHRLIHSQDSGVYTEEARAHANAYTANSFLAQQ